jgi:hypothetical protein
MNAEIGTEAAHFPEKAYINEIFVEVYNRYFAVSAASCNLRLNINFTLYMLL